jgi:exopolysaccharide biosynthesis polyprenyl glycosylphosphotransferase
MTVRSDVESAHGTAPLPLESGRRFARRADDGVAPAPPRPEVLSVEIMRRSAVVRRSLALADLLAAMTALLVVALTSDRTFNPAMFLLAVVVLFAAKVSRLYDRDEVRLRKSTLEEVPSLFQLTGLSALVLWLSGGTLFTPPIGRVEVIGLWAILFVAITVYRAVARGVADRLTDAERCLIVGDPVAALDVAQKISARGAEVVGVLPLNERRRGRNADDTCAEIEELVARTRAHRVIIVPGAHGDGETALACVTRSQATGAYVSILPRISEAVGSSVEFDHVDGMTLLGVHRFGLTRSSAAIKRAVDVVLSALGLLAVAPVLLVAVIAIKLDTPGPVLFRQRRMGHGGEPFEMFKLRTMRVGADDDRAALAVLSHAGDGLFKVAGDPRVTRVGAVLRRFSFDELPQLFNVLRGDMSLVGPRPLILEEDRRIGGLQRRGRLQLVPGITGPWQVLGTADLRVPMREMITLDYLYAGNWSLWTDVKILLRTVLHVVRGHGL